MRATESNLGKSEGNGNETSFPRSTFILVGTTKKGKKFSPGEFKHKGVVGGKSGTSKGGFGANF